jgi:hypothetical protein
LQFGLSHQNHVGMGPGFIGQEGHVWSTQDHRYPPLPEPGGQS